MVFLAAQATVVFGGHDYLERTTGVTYADYVHQGFGQLTVATALTLLVVWAAARRAGDARTTGSGCGCRSGCCACSPWSWSRPRCYRMHVYQEAYGFTTLRLVVDVFEGWLGLVVLTVMVAGRARPGPLDPAHRPGHRCRRRRSASRSLNPDAWVAGRNIDRYEETGDLDLRYLQSLSADARPVVAERLPERGRGVRPAGPRRPTSSTRTDRTVWGWNLGRERARDALAGVELPTRPTPPATRARRSTRSSASRRDRVG